MRPLNILITGSGIAGPSAAYWLTQLGSRVARITLLERSPSPRKTGQAIDIRGPGVPVMRKMGLEAAVRAHNTTERGMQKIGSRGTVVATLESTGDAANQAVTSEFEILRGDLAKLLMENLGEGVEVVYGEYVASMEQRDGEVWVRFANGRAEERYDLVVGADGTRSRTRAMVTGRAAKDDLKQGEGYVAYFTIPRGEGDSETYARVYNATGGRQILLRPTPRKQDIGAYLMVYNPADARLEEAMSQGAEKQKELLTTIFSEAGWESQRVCDAMRTADDFYYQQSAQVRLDEWVYDRVVLLGDAAGAVNIYGTSSALFGGYVLAGEISRHPDDLAEALASYQRIMRPKVAAWQNEPEWVTRITQPQSQFGVKFLNGIWWGVAGLRIPSLVAKLGGLFGGEESIPEYDFDAKL